MRVIGDKNQISEDVFDFMISYIPFRKKSIHSELAKLFFPSVYDSLSEICVGKSRKHCRTRRKCWLPAFFPLPTVFSEGIFLGVVKSRDCVVKGLMISFWKTLLQMESFYEVCLLEFYQTCLHNRKGTIRKINWI